ncbi:hypothetical protein FA13DRAFT_1819666 [Coprinellus micaceus]|uniref:Uncharacterized protein n=1 Tax=Coprinellus micaceus TaxID=71717 RepID=A0A4Y7SHH3_COPMI|nr:hypothetical protein FA13DRAFT_1819666 [Coprinellus micaceus]
MRLGIGPPLLLVLALPAVLSTPTWWLSQEGHTSTSSSSEVVSSSSSITSESSSLSVQGSSSESAPAVNLCPSNAIANEGSGRGIIGTTYPTDSTFHSAAWYREQDIRLLNFALTLSHLSSSFYTSSLSRYSQQCFEEKGYEAWVRNRFEQIAQRAEVHVRFLEEAIRSAGGEVVGRCEYNFPDREPPQAIELSEAFSTLAVSALTGVLKLIENKEYASALGSILGVEARISSWINSAVKKQSPWNMAFETPLTPSQVHSTLLPFTSSCPPSNTALLPSPLPVFPPLRFLLGPPAPPSPLSAYGEPSTTSAERSTSAGPSAYADSAGPRAHIEPGVEVEVAFDEGRYREGNKLYGAFMVGTGAYVQPVRVVEEECISSGGGDTATDTATDTDTSSAVGSAEGGTDSASGGGTEGAGDGAQKTEVKTEKKKRRRRFFLTPPEELRGVGLVYVTIVQAEPGSSASTSSGMSDNSGGTEADVGKLVRDENTVAGPAVVVFPFDSRGEGIE